MTWEAEGEKAWMANYKERGDKRTKDKGKQEKKIPSILVVRLKGSSAQACLRHFSSLWTVLKSLKLICWFKLQSRNSLRMPKLQMAVAISNLRC